MLQLEYNELQKQMEIGNKKIHTQKVKLEDMKTTLLGKKRILHDYEVMFRDHPEASAVTLRFPCPDCDQEFKSLFELKLHHE